MTVDAAAEEQTARALAEGLAAEHGVSVVQRGLETYMIRSDGTAEQLSCSKAPDTVWRDGYSAQKRRWRPKALVVPYTVDRRILLQSRKTISAHGEDWGFFGGGIEAHETPDQAAARELLEELTWQNADLDKIGAISRPMSPVKSYARHIFIAPLPTDWEARFKQNEGDAMQLFSVDAARALNMGGGAEPILRLVEEALTR